MTSRGLRCDATASAESRCMAFAVTCSGELAALHRRQRRPLHERRDPLGARRPRPRRAASEDPLPPVPDPRRLAHDVDQLLAVDALVGRIAAVARELGPERRPIAETWSA